jgi:prevent-host-death family protein
MKTAAVAELKARLSKFLSQVKNGEELLVTERGVPVARIVPVKATKDQTSHIYELEKAGLAVVGSGKIPKGFWEWKRPVDAKSKAVKFLIEERSKER